VRLSIKLKPTVNLEKKLSFKAKVTAFVIVFIPALLILAVVYTGLQNDWKIESMEEKINSLSSEKSKLSKKISKLKKQLKKDYVILPVIEDYADNGFWLKNRWSHVLDSIDKGIKPGALNNISLEYSVSRKRRYCIKWSMMLENTEQAELNRMIEYVSDNLGGLDFNIVSHTLDPFHKRSSDLLEVKLTGMHALNKVNMEDSKNE
jgi:hypothetical protein